MNKPLLPNWYSMWESQILTRKVRASNCEIYSLSDWEYLYLFLDVFYEDVLPEKREQFNAIMIRHWVSDLLWVIHSDYDLEIVNKVIKKLTSKVWFEAVAGMQELKNLFIQEVIEPIRNPEKYKKYKLWIPNWILLFWPPWCGKTFISRKLAEEVWYNFYEIKHSDVSSPYIHWGTWKIWEVFKTAKENKPSVVFFDEISWLLPKRDNLSWWQQYKEEEVNEFLMHLNDAWDNQILVVWATNFPDRIDEAIMRSGRMDKRIYVDIPDHEARVSLFKMYLYDRPNDWLDYNELALLTETRDRIKKERSIWFAPSDSTTSISHYFVASDIELLCDNFARKWLAQGKDITMDICKEVIKWFQPSLTQEQLDYYQWYVENYQRL